MKDFPYENATSGAGALMTVQGILAKLGCSRFGTMTDEENGKVMVQFVWRGRSVSLEASWKGYAIAYAKHRVERSRNRVFISDSERRQYVKRGEEIGRHAVCSILRDWVKGQITAVECGVLSFEEAFLPQMMLPSGERVVDFIKAKDLLPALPAAKDESLQ